MILLEKPAIPQTFYDGAQLNNFIASGESGRLFGCALSNTANQILISSGVLIIRGCRIKFDNEVLITFGAYPTINEVQQLVLRVVTTAEDSSVSVIVGSVDYKDPIDRQAGTYDYLLASYILTPSGISDFSAKITSLTSKNMFRSVGENLSESELIAELPKLVDGIYTLETNAYGYEFLIVEGEQICRYNCLGRASIYNATGGNWVPATESSTVFIRYSEYADGTDFVDVFTGQEIFIGVAIGQVAPTNKTSYIWAQFVGPQGIPGVGAEVEQAESEATDKVPSSAYIKTKMGTKADKIGGDIKDTVVAFTEAGARANIATGESTATLFGKIKKYFTDLKTHAFTAPSATLNEGTTSVPSDKLLYDTAAGAKSYVDTTTINPNILTNADFLINDLGTAVYNVTDTPTVNNWKIKLTNTAGSYTVATKILKSDDVDIGSDYVHLYQAIPNPMFYNGKTVTFSAKAKSTTGKWTLILWKGVSTIASVPWDTTLFKTLTYTIPAGTFTSNDTFSIAIRSYSEVELEYAKLEVGSIATAFSPAQNTIYSNQNQTITGIKTYSVSPLVPTTPSGPSAAVAKSYADSLRTVYDKVIRTQAEFDALIASATWLGATSVALVGQFTLSTANNSGIKIPATVKQIHGFNGAKITITNFVYNETTAKGGLWYATRPSTSGCEIRGVDLDISGDAAVGFCNCIGLRCSDIIASSSSFNAAGVYDCWDIDSIKSKATAPAGKTGYGFININGATKCIDGGSSTDMWAGTNTSIDVNTCRKTPEQPNNTTLNT